ncbi:MAG: L,D-transpeptidase family protein [Rhizobiales bacterium]|nr:L,D-transpeptidase family protein [Hyphomicrobiales bacterium]
MAHYSVKRRSFGRVLASLVLLAASASAIGHYSAPARAESGFEDFLQRLGAKKRDQRNVISNANSGEATVGGGKATTETAVVADQNIAPMLTPEGANELRAAESRYRQIIADGGFPKVSRSNLKKGAKGKNVIALNRRLFMEGYVRQEATEGEYAAIFTSATEEGVRRFQQNMGLSATGRLDGVTADALNIPAERRLAAIQANIPRLEEYAKDLGDRYVIVNIPAQQIETVQNGLVFSKHNAIVGRPERPSPVVMTSLSDINFNPYWNAPVSIVERDIIPKMKGGNDILREMNIKVFKGFGGPEIDPDTVNWRTAIPDDYHFRQEPGEHNAMATAKINFPSPFGVYMHDTPEKQLFNSSNRFYSSGCVRVQNMPLLVNWVLNGQEGIGEAQIATLAETLERKDVKLATPPQLRFAYLTAWPTTGGTIAFRKDIYELDGTGFVTGQPMPLGETSPDGKRFVLKPLPRLVDSVEDGNTGSGGIFGFRKKPTKPGEQPKSIFSTSNTDDRDGGAGAPVTGATLLKSNAPAKKSATGSKSASSAAGKSKPKKGLFDWTAYRKEQAAAQKKGTKTKVVTKKKPAADEKKVAAADAKDSKTKKKIVDTKAAEAKAGNAKVTDKKATDAKVAATDKKATDAKVAATDKKATDAAKKPAAPKGECKVGADGKLPDGCKAADAKKKVVPEATAAN